MNTITNPFEGIDSRLSNIEIMLSSMQSAPKEQKIPQEIEDQLLTVKQAANLLHLTISTLYGYVHRSEIPVNKVGKRLYFSKKELIDWVKSGRKKTITELEAEAEVLNAKRKGGKSW